jgi:hypothetical protein
MITSSVFALGGLLFDLPQKRRIQVPINSRGTVSVREQ